MIIQGGAGDINNDSSVDLSDAVLAFRIICGIPVQNVNLSADVNNDGKIGSQEAVYILQKVSQIRQ